MFMICYIDAMDFHDLVRIVGDEPVFESALLFAGDVDRQYLQRQLARWTAAGRIIQLRRGLYALGPPYLKVKPHPFVIANRLLRGSYVSCESALAHHGLIPEATWVTTSVTTVRPAAWGTPLGRFEFRRIKTAFFRGYDRTEVVPGQHAFLARPEKALLDLIYLRPSGDSPGFLRELRLQHLDLLAMEKLQEYSANQPKLKRAVGRLARLIESEGAEFEVLP